MTTLTTPEPGRLARLRRLWADSPWPSLLPAVARHLLLFVVLSLIGTGAVSAWLALLPIGAASPATAPAHASLIAGAAASATGTPTPTAPTAPDAGVADAATTEDAGTHAAAVTPDGKLVLNLAGESDLRRLPGVGPARAERILALRARLGRFRRVEELLQVKGMGRKALAKIRPLVVVDPPAPAP